MVRYCVSYKKYFIISLLFATPSLAQIDGGFYTTDHQINYTAILQGSQPNGSNAVEEGIANKSAPKAAPQSLAFNASAPQRKKNIAEYISRVQKLAPDYAPQLAADLGDGAVFDQYGQLLRSIGLDANNLGDNLAVWWITAWEASLGRPMETPPAAFAKVKEQVGRIISEKAIAAMTNAEKQRYSDSLVIQTMVLSNQIEQARGNPQIAKQLATDIKAGAKKMGFDLDTMTLTEDGFADVKAMGKKG
jgi:hypothetical protein